MVISVKRRPKITLIAIRASPSLIEKGITKPFADTLTEIAALSARVIASVSDELGEDVLRFKGVDREAAQELFEERLEGDEDFGNLVHDLIDDIGRRFDFLEGGILTRHKLRVAFNLDPGMRRPYRVHRTDQVVLQQLRTTVRAPAYPDCGRYQGSWPAVPNVL